ncbi:hypothetical protein [Pajaroellobacter abortibovis]|uniref:hypothetical protein n=1 Tax=Pajaroellobacter abortibovis TaxID=1882918 RepID=UPI0012EC6412|nr:hypothetical protein [Pajaroellobacter abortibovis]
MELGSSIFTIIAPTELRADAVVYLFPQGPTAPPILSMIVEVQRNYHPIKRFT